ncbi:MAG: NYN domain-containing protein [Gemmatimonadaceae bacterium]
MPTPDGKRTPPRELLGREDMASPAVSPASPAAAPPIRRALVDGSNVAHAGEGTRARLANILLVRDKLVEQGFEPIIVVDAALRHQVDDPAGYERLVEAGEVKQAPAGTDADYFLLSFARELGASIVSNDQFRDRSRQFAEIRRRVIRFMIVEDEVVLEKRTKRRK